MLRLGLIVAATVAALDQISKWMVLRHFDEPGCALRGVPVTSFFDLVLTCNRGVSFGMFNSPGISSVIFTVAAAIIVGVLVLWLARVRTGFLALAIGLIIGGAIGNVVDRMRFGAVIDFLSFHLPNAVCNSVWNGCWPAFNLADSAICLGVAAMLLDGLLLRRDAPQANRGEDVSP